MNIVLFMFVWVPGIKAKKRDGNRHLLETFNCTIIFDCLPTTDYLYNHLLGSITLFAELQSL